MDKAAVSALIQRCFVKTKGKKEQSIRLKMETE
jgi:hypothetical protein